nr:hypothetical protein CFP56_62106 [Quercus suber]
MGQSQATVYPRGLCVDAETGHRSWRACLLCSGHVVVVPEEPEKASFVDIEVRWRWSSDEDVAQVMQSILELKELARQKTALHCVPVGNPRGFSHYDGAGSDAMFVGNGGVRRVDDTRGVPDLGHGPLARRHSPASLSRPRQDGKRTSLRRFAIQVS